MYMRETSRTVCCMTDNQILCSDQCIMYNSSFIKSYGFSSKLLKLYLVSAVVFWTRDLNMEVVCRFCWDTHSNGRLPQYKWYFCRLAFQQSPNYLYNINIKRNISRYEWSPYLTRMLIGQRFWIFLYRCGIYFCIRFDSCQLLSIASSFDCGGIEP